MSNKKLNKKSCDTTILVSGGAGFIGSHTVVELLNTGYQVVVFDNLSNSSEISIKRIREITKCPSEQLHFIKADMCDKNELIEIFKTFDIDAIIHFAGLKSVGESVQKPLEYYKTNIGGTLNLCEVAKSFDVKNIIFSSSSTVYGDPEHIPVSEDCPRGFPTNPYGQTKHMQETILRDLYISDNEWNVVLLRYFNPIGAHKSGLIGEDPKGIPNNLVPYVAQVAVGKRDKIRVWGNDYDTPDGTGVRDYIHVVDLALGHVAALRWMSGQIGSENSANDDFSICGKPISDKTRSGVGVFNLGTGKGSSVLEVIEAFSKACGRDLPYEICERRPGDIAINYALANKAEKELKWRAKYDIKRMCQDSWNWQKNNPNGYE